MSDADRVLKPPTRASLPQLNTQHKNHPPPDVRTPQAGETRSADRT